MHVGHRRWYLFSSHCFCFSSVYRWQSTWWRSKVVQLSCSYSFKKPTKTMDSCCPSPIGSTVPSIGSFCWCFFALLNFSSHQQLMPHLKQVPWSNMQWYFILVLLSLPHRSSTWNCFCKWTMYWTMWTIANDLLKVVSIPFDLVSNSSLDIEVYVLRIT